MVPCRQHWPPRGERAAGAWCSITRDRLGGRKAAKTTGAARRGGPQWLPAPAAVSGPSSPARQHSSGPREHSTNRNVDTTAARSCAGRLHRTRVAMSSTHHRGLALLTVGLLVPLQLLGAVTAADPAVFVWDSQGELSALQQVRTDTAAVPGALTLALSSNLSSEPTASLETATGVGHGSSLAVGDFNGDGLDDIISGQPQTNGGNGAVVIHYADPSGGFGAGLMWTSGPPLARTGAALASADFNSDGFDDVAVGAPDHSPVGFSVAGQVRVFNGTAVGLDLASAW